MRPSTSHSSSFSSFTFFVTSSTFFLILCLLCSPSGSAPLPSCPTTYSSFTALTSPGAGFFSSGPVDFLSAGIGNNRIALIQSNKLAIYNGGGGSWTVCTLNTNILGFDVANSQFISLCNVGSAGNTLIPCNTLLLVTPTGHVVIKINTANPITNCNSDITDNGLETTFKLDSTTTSVTTTGVDQFVYFQNALLTFYDIISFGQVHATGTTQTVPNIVDAFVHYQYLAAQGSFTSLSGRKPAVDRVSRFTFSLAGQSPQFTVNDFSSPTDDYRYDFCAASVLSSDNYSHLFFNKAKGIFAATFVSTVTSELYTTDQVVGKALPVLELPSPVKSIYVTFPSVGKVQHILRPSGDNLCVPEDFTISASTITSMNLLGAYGADYRVYVVGISSGTFVFGKITAAAPSATPTISASSTISKSISVSPSLTRTPSSTISRSSSVIPSPSNSPTPSSTLSITSTPTGSVTRSQSITPSSSVSLSPSSSPSTTRSLSLTPSPSTTVSITSTPTSTISPGSTPSETPSKTSTRTPSVTGTPSGTPTSTSSSSPSPSRSTSRSPSPTPSITSSASQSPVGFVPSPSQTPTISKTNTRSPTQTRTQTQTATGTPTETKTPSGTPTQTQTSSGTPTPTASVSPSPSTSRSLSSSRTPPKTASTSRTASPSATQSASSSPSSTGSRTSSRSASASRSETRSGTSSPTPTSTMTQSATKTRTGSPSTTKTAVSSGTKTSTRTRSGSITSSRSVTPSRTATGSISISGVSQTPSATRSASSTRTPTRSSSPPPSLSSSPTGTPSSSKSLSSTRTLTPFGTSDPSQTPLSFPSSSQTPFPSDSASPSDFPTPFPSPSPSSLPSLSPSPSPSQSPNSSPIPPIPTSSPSVSPSPTQFLVSSESSSITVSFAPSASQTLSQTLLNPILLGSTSPTPSSRIFLDVITIPIDDGQTGTVTVELPPRSPPNQVIISQPDVSQFPSGQNEIRSTVLDVTFVNQLPEGSFRAQICLEVTSKKNGESKSDLCLGYFDEQKDRWVCQDSCLKRNSTSSSGKETLCGTTDHFTSFAILLVGGSVKGDKCKDELQYVTGSWRGDSGLVGALVLLMLIIALILIGLSYVPFLRKVFYGEEGARVKEARFFKGIRSIE